MLEMLAGLLVALAALAVVLEPMLRPGPARAQAGGDGGQDESDLVDLRDLDSPKVQALIALREIDFDRATGKLSDEDYARLKAKYEGVALEAIRAEANASPAPAAPAAAPRVEGGLSAGAGRAVTAGKSGNGAHRAVCPACGPRPEPAPIFCSGCGRSLVVASIGPRCRHCGAALDEKARFCAECGGPVAAGA
ncbi:MAG TPA: zinc ribbon domain-containing protein [Gemmatimonadales bacterium]|nr:zinc ribbon domain-containing protein [Gemmatimonadales bacterium]